MIWPVWGGAPPTMPDITLSSERVFVRPPITLDKAQWIAVRKKNRDFLEPYEPVWPQDCLTEEFFEKRLKRQARDWTAGRSHSFLIFKAESAVLIGGININNVCRGAGQSATLGYWLDENEQGRGYMAESLRRVIDFGFDELNLHRFSAGCLLHNEKSAKLLLGLGFEEEGFAKKYIKIAGRWQDHRLFGLPLEHWQDQSVEKKEISVSK